MNPQFFVRAARQWNRVLLCAMATHATDAQVAAYKAKRDASIARAKAFKARDRLRAQVRRWEADKAIQEFANAL